MELKESGENYLKTILILHNRTGYVRSIDIANEFGYSKASISRAMHILSENGYIDIRPDGEIVLTKEGKAKAEEVYEKHSLISKFLHEVLGVSKEKSDVDACRMEHVISAESFDKLNAFVDDYCNKAAVE